MQKNLQVFSQLFTNATLSYAICKLLSVKSWEARLTTPTYVHEILISPVSFEFDLFPAS